jgi:thiosulfate dehydrogenase (quinone) large subunit
MALDRQGTGLAIARIAIGVFFIVEGMTKYRWFLDASILARTLNEWLQAAAPGSVSRWYLGHVAMPGLQFFARLVPLGEIVSGIALVLGFWTPLFAFIAFFMAANYQVASGAMFRLSFLTSGYGLPVLGSTLGLAIGGVRLPLSVK